ncbi:TPA_asm: hypothetical protein vir520_00016 [Caudoviricetes sp. vir520]|nr:TPA_asm: hypothetical protein vir520_00016 [Caudoviricetes sp. vir520]
MINFRGESDIMLKETHIYSWKTNEDYRYMLHDLRENYADGNIHGHILYFKYTGDTPHKKQIHSLEELNQADEGLRLIFAGKIMVEV